jgi:hypothetical protein
MDVAPKVSWRAIAMSEMIEATMAVTKLGVPDLTAPEAFGPTFSAAWVPLYSNDASGPPIRARISRTDHRPGRCLANHLRMTHDVLRRPADLNDVAPSVRALSHRGRDAAFQYDHGLIPRSSIAASGTQSRRLPHF